MHICLTEKCSMGCTHCIDNCKPNGKDMSVEVFREVMNFIKRHKIHGIIISGGEIFEHENIKEILEILYEYYGKENNLIALSFNGRFLADNLDLYNYFADFIKRFGKKRLIMQVTDDERFYPVKLTQKQRYKLEKLGAIIDSVPGDKNNRNKCLYPQGRALKNFSEEYYNTIAPKCSNIRLLLKQNPNLLFGELCNTLYKIHKICTPLISVNGDIKMGESILCPSISNIYKSDKEIIEDMKYSKCFQCEYSWNRLKENNSFLYKMITEYEERLINEK